MAYNKLTMINYLGPYWWDTYTFAAAPPTLKINFNSFLAPFNLIIWLLILVMFALFIWLYLLNTLLENRKFSRNKYHHRTNFDIWIIVCILFRQYFVPFKKLNRSMKFIFVLTIICWIFIINFYFGYLCSMFSFPKFSVINTLEKLRIACKSNKIKTISTHTPPLQYMITVGFFDLFLLTVFLITKKFVFPA